MLDIAPASTDVDLELLISVRRRVDPEVHPQLANLRHFLATTPGGVYLLARLDDRRGCPGWPHLRWWRRGHRLCHLDEQWWLVDVWHAARHHDGRWRQL